MPPHWDKCWRYVTNLHMFLFLNKTFDPFPVRHTLKRGELEMKRASKEAIAELVRNTDGRFFTVTFKKRTDGEIRTMTARLGVKKHLKGGEKAFSDKEKGLITCFEMVTGGYRSFGVDAVICATIDGEDILAV